LTSGGSRAIIDTMLYVFPNGPIEPSAALQKALEDVSTLDEVLVLGMTKDAEIVLYSSSDDIRDILLLIELVKARWIYDLEEE